MMWLRSTGVWLLGFGLAWLLAGCAARRTRPAVTLADAGKAQFTSYCAACHVSNGPGMAAEAPPLEDSPWVTGPEDRLIKIVLQGLRGRIEIGGKAYDQEMPAVGKGMTDAQLATLLSFVRQRYAGSREPVLPAAVSRVRAATANRNVYWTADELLQGP